MTGSQGGEYRIPLRLATIKIALHAKGAGHIGGCGKSILFFKLIDAFISSRTASHCAFFKYCCWSNRLITLQLKRVQLAMNRRFECVCDDGIGSYLYRFKAGLPL